MFFAKRPAAHVFLVLCLLFSHPKPLKNKAECWPFLHILDVQINCFFITFGVIFPLEGTPGASRAVLSSRWGPGSVF